MKKLGVFDSWTKTLSFKRACTNPPAFVFPIYDAGNKVLFEVNLKLVLYYSVKNKATKNSARLLEIKKNEGRLHC